jgi:hypothetical protein
LSPFNVKNTITARISIFIRIDMHDQKNCRNLIWRIDNLSVKQRYQNIIQTILMTNVITKIQFISYSQ